MFIRFEKATSPTSDAASVFLSRQRQAAELHQFLQSHPVTVTGNNGFAVHLYDKITRCNA